MQIVKSRFYHLYFEDMVACFDSFIYIYISEREGGVNRVVIMVDVVHWFGLSPQSWHLTRQAANRLRCHNKSPSNLPCLRGYHPLPHLKAVYT